MADPGQHGCALLDLAVDALAHLQEGEARLTHFPRAANLEVDGQVSALAIEFGRAGKVLNRPDLVAQEQDRQGDQEHRSADHPQQEDVRV